MISKTRSNAPEVKIRTFNVFLEFLFIFVILAAGTWWLSLVGPGSEFLTDILPGMIVLALGLATLGAPLTSATLSAVGEQDQGIASGVNNTVGQLAGLLMIVVLPAVAGLSGKSFDGPDFADGYQIAMQACTLLCLIAAGIAGATIRSGNAEGASRSEDSEHTADRSKR